jgi:hypothetical protein
MDKSDFPLSGLWPMLGWAPGRQSQSPKSVTRTHLPPEPRISQGIYDGRDQTSSGVSIAPASSVPPVHSTFISKARPGGQAGTRCLNGLARARGRTAIQTPHSYTPHSSVFYLHRRIVVPGGDLSADRGVWSWERCAPASGSAGCPRTFYGPPTNGAVITTRRARPSPGRRG